eukprot:g6372.t1
MVSPSMKQGRRHEKYLVLLIMLVLATIPLTCQANPGAQSDVISLADGLTLATEFVGSKSENIRITASFNVKTWLGFGISQGTGVSMTGNGNGAEIYVCTDGVLKKYWVKDTYLNQGVEVGGDATCIQKQDSTILSFTRPLRNNVKGTGLDITPKKYQQVIYAHGEANKLQVGYHGKNRGGKEVRLGSSASKSVSKRNAEASLWAHIILMVLSWGFLLPLGVVVANRTRDMNTVRGDTWFVFHRTVQYIGWTLQIVGFACAIVYCQLHSGHFTQIHTKIGLGIFVIGTLQPLNAYFRPHLPDKNALDETKSSKRSLWEFMHKGLGYVAVAGGIINVILGILLVSQKKAYEAFVTDYAMAMSIICITIVGLLFLFTLIVPNSVALGKCLGCCVGEMDEDEKSVRLLDSNVKV